jgi:hypothetical protein
VANEFVRFEVESDAQTLADRAVDRLRAEWEDYEPNDGDLEIVTIEAVAPMAQNSAESFGRVTPAIFRAFGEKLVGVPYEQGTQAVGTVTFMLVDSLGHVIPAGTEVDIDGYAFATIDPVSVPSGDSIASGVSVEATLVGAAQNGLAGEAVAMITALAFVEDVTLDDPTEGGADPDTDEVYQNNLTRELQLGAKTLVTARDYELMGLSVDGVFRLVVTANTEDRVVTVVPMDEVGEAVSTAIKDRLEELYTEYRLATWELVITDATYTPVNVIYAIKPEEGFDHDDLMVRVEAQLTLWLSPEMHGRPKNFGDPGSARYKLEPVIRRNKLIDLIGDVDGVDYVDDVTITAGAGTVDGDGNLTLPGAVPLPTPGTIEGGVV